MKLVNLLAVVPALLASACNVPTGTLPSRCEAIEVDASRELVVTDETVLADPRFSFEAVTAGVPGDISALGVPAGSLELVAISNRIDLTTEKQPAELRFVYGLVAGAERQPFTVGVELRLPDSQTTAQWASAWHALGSLSGQAYTEALASLVASVLDAPPVGQVRTQDARTTPATLRQFDVGSGPLVAGLLPNQPSPIVGMATLAGFVSDNAALIPLDQEVLPESLLARTVQALPPGFDLPGVSSDLTTTFEEQTCAGCHSMQPTVDGTFHVSPLRRGSAALSPFLGTTDDPTSELSRRAEVLRGLLCQ